MILRISVLVATAVVIFVNYLSAIGAINGRDAADISKVYPTEITPAGYAFSIWSLIYLGMIAFSIYQLVSKNISKPVESVRALYLSICGCNILWILTWHYDVIPVSLGLMLLLLALLARVNVLLQKTESTAETLLIAFPFSLYFGWVTVATILNATIALIYGGVSFAPTTTSIVGALLIVVATVIGIVIRFKIDRMGYPLAIAWGVTAIGVEQSGDTIVVIATAFGMMALVFAALWGYVKDR